MIALTVISTDDTHNHKPRLYTKVVSPRENRYINVDLFIQTAYFEGRRNWSLNPPISLQMFLKNLIFINFCGITIIDYA